MSGGRRERILEAALDLFTERSYAAATMDELAERAGVSKGLVFYHFGSKGRLLSATAEPFLSSLQEVLHRHEGRTKREPSAILKEYFDLSLEHIDVFRLLHLDATVASQAEVGSRLASLRGRLRELLSDNEVAASAALGAFVNPLLHLADQDPASVLEQREELVTVATLTLERLSLDFPR